MTKLAKTVVTCIVIFVFIILSIFNSAARDATGHSTPGVIGMILLVGVIGAIRMIWDKGENDNNNKNDEGDNSILQK